MNKPLISVCIPVFNGEKYIRECIASVLSQSEKDFEILISDNCSTDQTIKLCNEFQDPRIRMLTSERNVGSIANFNKCIQNASGELFMLLPADDLLESDCLQILSTGFAGNASVGMAFGSINLIDEQGEKNRTNTVVEYDGVFDSKGTLKLIAEKFNPLQHPMIRLKTLDGLGGYDLRYGCFCDLYLWLEVLFAGWHAFVARQPVTALRSHQDQGQALFRHKSKSNLKKLSDHYGYSLPSDFYKKNQINLKFFEFVQFFNHRYQEVFRSSNDLEKIMMTHLVRSHLGNLYTSLKHFNLSSCKGELALTIALIKKYGIMTIIRSYFSLSRAYFLKKYQGKRLDFATFIHL